MEDYICKKHKCHKTRVECERGKWTMICIECRKDSQKKWLDLIDDIDFVNLPSAFVSDLKIIKK